MSMNCQYYDNNFETCTNGDCPFCSDFCPVTENQEVCRYSELDDTETMLRRCLDAEKEDSREAIQALAEENKDLKKQLEKVKAERDAAVECIPHECKTCVYHTVFFNGCTPDHDCTNPDGGCSNNYDRWEWRGPQKEE